MAMIDFALRQTCTIHPWIRVAEGQDIYGPPETRACRIQRGHHLGERHVYLHPDGPLDTVEAKTMMYCTGEMIPTRSRVECDGASYIVLDCYEARGFGVSHLEVFLQ